MSSRSLTEETSRQIVVCRVLCIFFMMSVHVSPGFDADDWSLHDPMHWVGAVWADVLGRSSVPTLSVISGFLLAVRPGRGTFGSFARKRLGVLIAPMLFWNAVLAAMVLAPAALLGHRTATHRLFFEAPWPEVVFENLLFLYGSPANVPLAFLRDLFVCGLIVFLLLRHARWALVPGLIASVAAWMTTGYGELLLRPSLLSFVLAGAVLGVHAGYLEPPRRLRPVTYGLLLLVVVGHWLAPLIGAEPPVPEPVERLIFRAIVTACVLDFALLVARSRFFAVVSLYGPVAYLAYLSHSVVISALWEACEPLIGGSRGPLYVAFFLVTPAVVFAFARLAFPFIDRMPAWLQVLVRGKAAPGTRRPGEAPAPKTAATP